MNNQIHTTIHATYADFRDAFKRARRIAGSYVSGSDRSGYSVKTDEPVSVAESEAANEFNRGWPN
jgi:predicted GNAT family acetyltransferase